MLERLKRWRPVEVGIAVLQRFGEDGGNNMAAAVAYYGFLSLFPLLLLALAVIGFVLARDPAAQVEWARRLSDAVPGLGGLIGENVEAVVDGRGAVTAVGIVGLAWTGSGIVQAAGIAMNRIFRVRGYESFFRQKWWQFRSLATLGILALVATAVTGTAAALDVEGAAGVALRIAVALLGLSLDVALFMLAYRLLTQRRGPRFGKLWPGALLAAVGWTVLKLAGSWYAAGVVAGATAVYGTFAAVVGVLVLLHLAARVLLYGAELDAVLIEEKGGGPMRDPRKEPDEGQAAGEKVVSTSAVGDGRPHPRNRSTPDLMVAIATDSATLVRKEIELARQEVMESITSRLRTVAAMAAAGAMGLFALAWLSASLAWALDEVLQPWASRLIVGAIFLVLAGVVFAVGKVRPKPPLAETKRTIKEDVAWARAQLRR